MKSHRTHGISRSSSSEMSERSPNSSGWARRAKILVVMERWLPRCASSAAVNYFKLLSDGFSGGIWSFWRIGALNSGSCIIASYRM